MAVAFIGAGKMAKAFIHALLDRQVLTPAQLTVTARSQTSKESFLGEFPRCSDCWREDIPSAVKTASTVFIAVKPQQIREVLPSLKNTSLDACFISIAAGIRISTLEEALGTGRRIVRAMPNTPVILGKGVTAYTLNPSASSSDEEQAKTIFSTVGRTFRVEERAMDAVTALSGSGPAYFYLFIDYLRQAAERNGLDADVALEMAAATAEGAGGMLLQTRQTPEHLIEQVKSKGGTTEAGLHVFQNSALAEICHAALTAATQRSIELGNA